MIVDDKFRVYQTCQQDYLDGYSLPLTLFMTTGVFLMMLMSYNAGNSKLKIKSEIEITLFYAMTIEAAGMLFAMSSPTGCEVTKTARGSTVYLIFTMMVAFVVFLTCSLFINKIINRGV